LPNDLPTLQTIVVKQHPDGPADDGAPHNVSDNFKFKYHHVLHNASQETVYQSLTCDVVQGVMDGVNGTVMTYGQTGAGKTFTMVGDTRNYQHRGIAPRAIAQVFAEVGSRIETEFQVHVSYMEIYNERIFDLLDDMTKSERKAEYAVVDDAKGGRGTYVRGLTMKKVNTEGEALNELFNGELGRTTAEHKLNKRSNRSHCIFTVYVSQRSRTGVSERVLHSKLNLIDLAGSERLKKTMDDSSGIAIDETTKKESMYINQSLTYLEQCVVALSKKTKAHVPYRQTKLTSVLKDSLGGNCNTLMFACIWGEAKHIEETISTLRLAQRMMRVQNETNQNVQMDPVQMLRKYEKEIKELKQELMMHDALSERSGVVYDEYTPEQRKDVEGQVRKFVQAGADEEDDLLQVDSMRQVREIFRQFKVLVKVAEASVTEVRNTMSRGGIPSAGAESGMAGMGGTMAGLPDMNAQGDLVGSMEDTAGFGVGRASDNARPANLSDLGLNPETSMGDDDAMSMGALSPLKKTTFAQNDSAPPPVDRNEAYTMFKSNQGSDLNAKLLTKRHELKKLKHTAKEASEAVNSNKREIEALGREVEEKKQQRLAEMSEVDGAEDIVDEEEFILMKKEKEAKGAYRAGFGELKAAKAQLEGVQKEVTALKTELLEKFDRWHQSGSAQETPAPEVDPGDQLDDGEQFDKMEIERIIDQDPDSVAFFQAHKKMAATQNANRTTNMRKQKLKRNI
jgi:kinesin family protein 6/9